MNPIGLIITVVIILVISAVVTAITQFMNKVNEANTVNRRVTATPRTPPRVNPVAENETAAPPKKVEKDMDRFLAEIDRLRRKNAPVSAPAEQPRPAATPTRTTDRPKPRVVATVVEAPRPAPSPFPSAPPPAFPAAPPAPPSAPRVVDLPVATVISPTSVTGVHATRVTTPTRRATPAPKTAFGKEFAALLSTGKGAAMAVILQEVLGPPKSQRR
jgi:hypothetical protein